MPPATMLVDHSAQDMIRAEGPPTSIFLKKNSSTHQCDLLEHTNYINHTKKSHFSQHFGEISMMPGTNDTFLAMGVAQLILTPPTTDRS